MLKLNFLAPAGTALVDVAGYSLLFGSSFAAGFVGLHVGIVYMSLLLLVVAGMQATLVSTSA